MIKKVLWLAVTLFTFVWVSFWVSHNVWVYWQLWDYEDTVLKYWSLLTQAGGYTRDVFAFSSNIYFFRTSSPFNWYPYVVYPQKYGDYMYEWFFQWFNLCDNFTWLIDNYPQNCNYYEFAEGNIDLLNAYLAWVSENSVWYANYYGWDRITSNYLMWCVSTDYTRSICLHTYGGGSLTWSLHISNQTRMQVPSWYIGKSPYLLNSGGDGILTWNGAGWSSVTVESDVSKSIKYFEDLYNWDQGMCYVWTNNLTAPYWTAWISFDFWTGDTIFSLFYSLYSWFGDNRIQNVWRFINTWLINYKQWFEKPNWNIQFLASYAGPWNNVEYIYTWFTFPFKDNPVAIYFMANLLNDQYSRYQTQWEEMAYYCYMKLNKQAIEDGDLSFEDIQNSVTPAINNNINTYNNEVLPKWRVGYQVPNLSWSIWGDVVSWNNYQWTLDPTTIFDQLYNNVFSLVWNWSSRTWILPDWIVFPLLFLILFRIMKH